MNEEERQRFMEILRMKTTDNDLLLEALELLKHAKSLDYCRNIMIDLEEEIQQEIVALGGNPMMENILDKFRCSNKYVLSMYHNRSAIFFLTTVN